MDILAVTTQAHEGIETPKIESPEASSSEVTTQAHEGIETPCKGRTAPNATQ